MIHASGKMPDFAGVALVDILANGVAMLIIVIVVSIAARVERDERYAEQADEVAAVMSHKLSTSLVLNSLAASPPAVLHDYETSPTDQVLGADVLPILELHSAFVREFYSGTIWSRREMLGEFNRMSAWLAGFSNEQKQRLRLDVYDVTQFYLAMSILREHGIKVRHWHFLTGSLSPDGAAGCPPGVAAKDCLGGAAEDSSAPPSLTLDESDPGDDPDWPLFEPGEGRGAGSQSSLAGSMPGGVVPGVAGSEGGGFGEGFESGFGGAQPGSDPQSAAGLGSFPNTRGGENASATGNPSPRGRRGSMGSQSQVSFRIALPEFVQRAVGAGNDSLPTLEAMFGAMLHYLGELQATLDSGGTPSRQIAGFTERLQSAFRAPPPLTKAEQVVALKLAVKFSLLGLAGQADARASTLALSLTPPQPGEDTLLVVAPNRLSEAARISRATQGNELPEHGRISLALNAYPGIWKGLDLRLEPGSVLLLPPEARQPEQMRWRAVAHISPGLEDFIVGFVFADIDAQGRLRVQADANRVRLGGQSLFSVYKESAFGARGWLVSLYAALVAGALLLVLTRRLLTGRNP